MLDHHGVTPNIKFAGTHLYACMREKCLAQEHNTKSLGRVQTWSTKSGAECTSHEFRVACWLNSIYSTFGFNLSSSELLFILTREFCDTSTCFLALSLCFTKIEEVSCWLSVTPEHKSNLLTKNFHSHHPMVVVTLLSNWQLRCCCIRRNFYSRMKWWPTSSRIKLGWWAVSRSKTNEYLKLGQKCIFISGTTGQLYCTTG